jgi:polysaccharide deacetylase family protein (PEP-CTERM system associated)
MRADRSPAPPLAGSGDPHNAFTVDLEEWFHVCGVERLGFERWTTLPSRVEPTTRWLLDALDRADVRATFFIVGWVAERFPRLVEAVRAAGHEIGSHGHAHRRVYELDGEVFRRDLQASVQALKVAGVDDVSLFRAPEWSVNERSLWALDVLVEEGFRLDASMAPLTMVGSLSFPRHPHVRQTIAGPIVEVPPLVADRFGQVIPLGWGWGLRMSSPHRVLDAIERLNRRGQPAVLTVHPWEIDQEPPRVRLPARLHFAHYFRMDGFAERLRAILSGASFGPIGRIVPTASASS